MARAKKASAPVTSADYEKKIEQVQEQLAKLREEIAQLEQLLMELRQKHEQVYNAELARVCKEAGITIDQLRLILGGNMEGL